MAMSSATNPRPTPAEVPLTSGVVLNGTRYLRAPVPVHFPEAELVPESKRHLKQRSLLFEILSLHFADRALIGCDQFVYWDPTDPKQCLSPDAFVRLGGPDEDFRSWKVWERGAPDLAVEIVSHSDSRDNQWEPKLEKYRRLGVRELVRFEAEEGAPLSFRIWDSLENDLVERGGVERVAVSRVLSATWWVVVDEPDGIPRLRLSRDAEGKDLYPTSAERVLQLQAELARRNR